MAKDEKDVCYQFLSFGMWRILSYAIQDYYWPRSSYSTYFEEPYIPQIREELHVEENTFLEEYVEVKEENIEISEEIMTALLWKKNLK